MSRRSKKAFKNWLARTWAHQAEAQHLGATLSQLVAERQRQGTTLKALSKQTGVSTATLYRLRHGLSEGRLSTWSRISTGTRVSIRHLLSDVL